MTHVFREKGQTGRKDRPMRPSPGARVLRVSGTPAPPPPHKHFPSALAHASCGPAVGPVNRAPNAHCLVPQKMCQKVHQQGHQVQGIPPALQKQIENPNVPCSQRIPKRNDKRRRTRGGHSPPPPPPNLYPTKSTPWPYRVFCPALNAGVYIFWGGASPPLPTTITNPCAASLWGHDRSGSRCSTKGRSLRAPMEAVDQGLTVSEAHPPPLYPNPVTRWRSCFALALPISASAPQSIADACPPAYIEHEFWQAHGGQESHVVRYGSDVNGSLFNFALDKCKFARDVGGQRKPQADVQPGPRERCVKTEESERKGTAAVGTGTAGEGGDVAGEGRTEGLNGAEEGAGGGEDAAAAAGPEGVRVPMGSGTAEAVSNDEGNTALAPKGSEEGPPDSRGHGPAGADTVAGSSAEAGEGPERGDGREEDAGAAAGPRCDGPEDSQENDARRPDVLAGAEGHEGAAVKDEPPADGEGHGAAAASSQVFRIPSWTFGLWLWSCSELLLSHSEFTPVT